MEHVWFTLPSCGLQAVVVAHARVPVPVHEDGVEVGLGSQLLTVSKQEVIEAHDCVLFQFPGMHARLVAHVEYVLTLQEDPGLVTREVVRAISLSSDDIF